MTGGTITIATRGSALALAQVALTRTLLQSALPHCALETLVLSTTGDRQTQWKLHEHGGRGLFTKELEDALLEGRADIAVHSAKDMSTELPDGLAIAGYLPRADARDVLVRRENCPCPALIASGSPRRREQGAKLWPEAKWTELRGNVETRLRKIAQGQADATILAAAGLARLGISAYEGLVFEPIGTGDMIPAAGQAAIAIECRVQDLALYEALLDKKTTFAVSLERALLKSLGGGCHSAVAAFFDGELIHAHLPGGKIWKAPICSQTIPEALLELENLAKSII